MPDYLRRIWRKLTNRNRPAIVRRFKGYYETTHTQPHMAGLIRRFAFIKPPAAEDRIRLSKEEHVIRTQDEFFSFIARIPKKDALLMPTKKPSTDVLLKYPKLDFHNYMVLVIIAHEPNCFIDSEITAVTLDGNALRVLCRYGAPGPVRQKVINYGTYSAVVVDRFDGDVVFVHGPA